jgi:hypothetical protein
VRYVTRGTADVQISRSDQTECVTTVKVRSSALRLAIVLALASATTTAQEEPPEVKPAEAKPAEAKPAEAKPPAAKNKKESWNLPVVQLDLGPAIHVADKGNQVTLAIDVTLGAALGRKVLDRVLFGEIWVFPEIGYTYDSFGSHLFFAGCGVGYGGALISLAYTPRFVAGETLGATSLGFRHGLSLHVLFDIFSAELGHEVLVAGPTMHDIRIMFGFNPGAMIYGLIRVARETKSKL